MNDLYLRVDTESDAQAALRDAGLMTTDEDGNEHIDGAPLTSVCVLGTLYDQTGTETVDGEEVPTYTAIDGWHVNVRTRDDAVADNLRPLDVAPKTPRVVWAGSLSKTLT